MACHMYRSYHLFTKHVRKFSTVAATELSEPAQKIINKQFIYQTRETNPINHGKEHLNMFYEIPPAEGINSLFRHGGLTRKFAEQCDLFKELLLMVRKPSLEIIHYLKHADYTNPLLKIVPYGELGAGKSLSMAHTIHYAYRSGFLIIHLFYPQLWKWSKKVEIVKSLTKAGLYDTPVEASMWLSHFRSQNEELLKRLDLKVSRQHNWSARESTEIGDSILQLVDFGITRNRYACDIMEFLFQEIKELSRSNKIKTLVVIDGFNSFFEPFTRLRSEAETFLKVDEMTITGIFLELTKADWHNSAALLVCEHNPRYRKKGTSDLLNQLTEKGFEHVHPFIPVEFPKWTRDEIKAYLAYYKHKKWLRHGDNGDKELELLCAGNPGFLMHICRGL